MANTLVSESVWLRLVVGKLRYLADEGADFERTRWIFSWNKQAALADNLATCEGEETALLRLAEEHVVTVEILDGAHDKAEDYQLNEKESHGVVINVMYDHGGDPAGAYGRAIWITGLNRDRLGRHNQLIRQEAVLSFSRISAPSVAIGGCEYTLHAMSRNGRAFQIIEYCLNSEPGRTVTLSELKKVLRLSGVSNLKQALRRTPFDAEGLLQQFVVATPDTILVQPVVALDTETVGAIAARQKPSSCRNK